MSGQGQHFDGGLGRLPAAVPVRVASVDRVPPVQSRTPGQIPQRLQSKRSIKGGCHACADGGGRRRPVAGDDGSWTPSFDLAGTTRVGDRPEPNAVVWLETTAASGARRERWCSISATSPSALMCSRSASARRWSFPIAIACSTTSSRSTTASVSTSACTRSERSKHVTFGKPGLSRIFCNIHPNMAAYVHGGGQRVFRGVGCAGRS